MKPIQRSDLLQALSWVFIFLFVYTASSKLMDLKLFRLVVSESPLVGAWANGIALGVPLAELLVALLLLFPRTQPVGMAASLVLMVLFTAYIGYMMLAAPHLPCSCGGVLKQLTWKQHLLLNTGLALLAGGALLLARRPSSSTSGIP